MIETKFKVTCDMCNTTSVKVWAYDAGEAAMKVEEFGWEVTSYCYTAKVNRKVICLYCKEK